MSEQPTIGNETPQNLWEWIQGALRTLATVHEGTKNFDLLSLFLRGESLSETALFRIREGSIDIDGEELILVKDDEDHVVREKLTAFLRALLDKVTPVPPPRERPSSDGFDPSETPRRPFPIAPDTDPGFDVVPEDAEETIDRILEEVDRGVEEAIKAVDRGVEEALRDKDRAVKKALDQLEGRTPRPRGEGISDQDTDPGVPESLDDKIVRWSREIEVHYNSLTPGEQLESGVMVDVSSLSHTEKAKLKGALFCANLFNTARGERILQLKPGGRRETDAQLRVTKGGRQPRIVTTVAIKLI
jgi:hypothetical protein